ncbi:glutamyl/tRNA (Gln) amidotransferase subunit C [Legionella hackeliae]|uniref:Aspartyl/glutamyl-tRNA(Asn/Gln) amidotransferase subunit C n=2 Tax=Legionella hackeliae TaxID=449 RepID=A0A0A8UNY0_LEGHA|nr:Asp-tRNA(Asn)/Glu-tRNA(Gln) amidotransferase subunit GatC [Legionella hackeliae]KTD13764.1 glutamyl/tRNA (Gln) amidotransferase subunit C [Legionella hackeliae]CEK10463.1 Aspartyl/glutamyl-tRNA(Asn/Gln) amidotransferase subunit C [Legionella hackeliae]STX47199.1 glutamyl/tRNA (Gln) amidotransferase subunit C [Legionella hackeliae]
MAITQEDLGSIKQLAYLDDEVSEHTKLAEEINAIMDFVEQLKQVDTTGIAPLFHPFDLHQRLRDDEVKEPDCIQQLAAIAPVFEDNLYLVPKVIDSGQ